MAKYLIEHNADVNQSNAVVFAARAGYTDVVKLLLEHGPNPAKLEEAYQSAIAEHHSDAAELLRSSKK